MTAFLRWAQVLLYAGLIFYLSSLSDPPMPFFWRFQKYRVDLFLHGIEYMVLGLLLIRAMQGQWALSFLIGALYAVSDEWHQHFVPPRDASFADWAADAIGVGLGIWLWTKRNRDYAGD